MGELLKSMKPNDEVPAMFSEGIDALLEQLPEKKTSKQKRKSRPWLYTGAASVILSFSIISSGFLSPAMANVLKEVPLIGSIFSESRDPVLQKVSEQGMVSEIQKTATDQGITLSLKEVFFDGSRLAIGYVLEMPPKYPAWKKVSPINFSATVNQKENLQYMSTIEENPIGANQYTGKIDMFIDIMGPAESPLMMQLAIDEVHGVKGNWNFNFPLENEKVKHVTHTFKPQVTSKLQDVSVTLEEVAFTPATTQLVIKKNGPKEKLDDVYILIFDELGAYLGGIAAWEIPTTEHDGSVSVIQKASLDALETVPDKLQIVLLESKKFIDSADAPLKEYSFDAKSPWPQEIPIGKNQNIWINDVQFTEEQTTVQIEIQGELTLQNQYLSLESNGETFHRIGNPAGIPGKPNSFILTYPAIKRGADVTISTVVDEKQWDRQWKLMEVPLK